MVLRNCKYALWGFEANTNVDEIKIRFCMNEYIIITYYIPITYYYYYYDKPTVFSITRFHK